jgi:Fe-S-cluster containining protein
MSPGFLIGLWLPMSFRIRNGQLVKSVTRVSPSVRVPLPVVDCSSCVAACCQYQGRPPLSATEEAALPVILLYGLAVYDQEVRDGKHPRAGTKARKAMLAAAGGPPLPQYADPADIDPCLWLDTETHRCKFHEHRPEACREFVMGGSDCLTTRAEFRVPLPLA